MSKRTWCGVGAALLIVSGALAPVSAQVCTPLDNGRLADVFYEGTALFWDPVVEYQKIVLTITGPCEDIVRAFGPTDEITFDIREIKRVVDGQYSWTLKREASIDPDVQESLQAARGSGEEEDLWWSYFQAGKIPAGPYTDSGSFSVVGGEVIDPTSGVEKVAMVEKAGGRSSGLVDATLAGGFTASEGSGNELEARYTIAQSLCVGFDCASSPTFSDTTILLTENNTRIKFDDTSTVGSYPRTDWELQANSNANGGGSYFAINDCGESSQGGCAEDPVFLVEGGAPSNALRVDNGGRVGFGTANPSIELHVVDGDSPGLRLQQDGSSGFAPQSWDVVGNETNFFVRDVTNGSTLPFRIRPGASSNSLFIDTDDDVGVGTSSPDEALDVERNGNVSIRLTKGDIGRVWNITNDGPIKLNEATDPDAEFSLTQGGNLTIQGTITTSGSCSGGCDLVFDPDYDLESIEEHAAEMWAKRHLPSVGPTPENGPFNLSEKTGGILNELEKAHIYIEQLNRELDEQRGERAELARQVEALNERLDQLLGSAQN